MEPGSANGTDEERLGDEEVIPKGRSRFLHEGNAPRAMQQTLFIAAFLGCVSSKIQMTMKETVA